MGAQRVSDKAERVWRAVLAHLKEDATEAHDDCDQHPPKSCTLYAVIADAMGTEEES